MEPATDSCGDSFRDYGFGGHTPNDDAERVAFTDPKDLLGHDWTASAAALPGGPPPRNSGNAMADANGRLDNAICLYTICYVSSLLFSGQER